MTDSLSGLVQALRSGGLSVDDYLSGLEQALAERESEILALVPEGGRFERLAREAAALTERYPRPEGRPPLFGLPVGIKDIFHVAGFATRAGSQVPAEKLAGPQAEVVTALKEAGALIFGKTVTTEFAYFGPGPTRNPHDTRRTPGGSSSGSAAAVAAGFCPFTLGTQTIGSISRPASFCGVVGYKPSYDRISREGVIPLSPSLDHVGIFTPAVGDVGCIAAVVCDSWDESVGVDQPVLGVPEGPYLERASAAGLAHFRSVVERLETSGYEVRRVAALDDFAEIERRHRVIVAAECAAVHRDWYPRYGKSYHPKTAELIEEGMEIDLEQLTADLAGREGLRWELTAAMEEHGIDFWISPATPDVAPEGLESTGDPVMNLPWTQAGLPTLAIPAGTIGGMPVGLQMVARWWQDEKLLVWGAELDKALGEEAR